ncbi:7,8-dihydropteroate synthase [Rubrivivax sp. A210]|uniref:dihydropteroate synthase n=1 Tax=Rubrivivax sp. A210 TaxID=2772301 RepID=UPI0019188FFB|nr:dihydropteroate synthase [Rubrivivax sp. A210]CAD5373945.1 7,8-dihydropteroate synthase [Rubrivivax sp. A210]
MRWLTTRHAIDLTRPRVMAIVNVTPDSFSDGGRHDEASAAIAHCERLLADGADILDIGGESTRPGAALIDDATECARVLPVLRAALTLGVPVSVDTSSPALMRQALDLGADIINDVRSLRRPGALACLAAHGRAGICLMHMRGEPATMAADTVYGDVVGEVGAFLAQRLAEVRAAGIDPERIVLDPGIGFAKRSAHNLQLLARQAELLALGRPLLVGWSRKGTLGRITGRVAGELQAASAAAALIAVVRGAAIVRVHDVRATVDALRVLHAVQLGRIEAG